MISSFYFLKFFFLVLDILTCWIIVSTLRRLKLPYKNALLYLWNPLIVIELVGQAHTEVIMVGAFAFTVMLVSRRKYAAGAVSFALAVLGKITILLYAPFLFRKIGWKWALVSLAVVVGAVAPFYYPQLIQNYVGSLQLYFDYFAFNAGIYYALTDVFRWIGLHAAVPVLGSVLGVLAGILVVVLYILTKDSSVRDIMKHGLYAGMIFLLLTTTLHPWYLALIIIALPFVPKVSVMWWGLFAGWSYLAYTVAPPLEHRWLVYLGYGVLLILVAMEMRRFWLKPLIRRRATWKAERILPHIRGKNILDVGAAEGWVGEELRRRRPDWKVFSVDVIRMQRAKIPAVLYDGRDLPFGDRSIDSAYAVFVLHHCRFPDHVVQEVHRVVRNRFIVMESVYQTRMHKRLLEFLDGRVNAFRSNNKMAQPLHFDTIKGWKAQFVSHGFTITSCSMIKSGIHHQALFVLERGENQRH
ncbi:MAG: methyltransferase domain-containing protein [Chlorobi bacterium]|nr:methyltransferase domain-containing protein [Chlorobiota bacterium]